MMQQGINFFFLIRAQKNRSRPRFQELLTSQKNGKKIPAWSLRHYTIVVKKAVNSL
jgi:preprotein translocase subunit YajC